MLFCGYACISVTLWNLVGNCATVGFLAIETFQHYAWTAVFRVPMVSSDQIFLISRGTGRGDYVK